MTTVTRPWNALSEVRVCETCNGLGTIAHPWQQATVWDPYPEAACPDCGGIEHEPECEVCGFQQVVKGYDCASCDFIASLTDADLKVFSPMKFAASLIKAMGRRRAA